MSIFEGSLIALIVLGALGYLVWRWYEGRKAPEKCDSCSLSGRERQ